jgi:4-hydroxybenzoate polyprenyltransferase|tara:strand:+ start:284 stop:499 length:216 start_codon:yes stop_codon:yes gene_type:complete
MKKYFNWLMENSQTRKSTAKAFWALMYLIFLAIVIHEAITDSPKALLGLAPVGAMIYHQWREFRSDTKQKK